ncbi:MAG: hypothetical protein VX721_01460, partial [Thermoproteota archaeon]|nr:hypothetical protein [Thermoproteota archaeon]
KHMEFHSIYGRELFMTEKPLQFMPPPIIGEFFYGFGGRNCGVTMVLQMRAKDESLSQVQNANKVQLVFAYDRIYAKLKVFDGWRV